MGDVVQLPRSVRNNNPGNIRIGDPWQGLMDIDEMNADQKQERSFCVFQSPKWGFRALATVLITYQDKHDINTIVGIINRWAPSAENDTHSYIVDVALRTNLNENAPLDLHTYEHLAPICKAIATHEAGKWLFDDKDLASGLRLAGVEAPIASLTQSRTVKTGVISSGGVVGVTAVVQAVQQLQPAIEIVSKVKEYWPYAAITILVIAIAVMVWDRIDDHMRAKR